MAVKRARLSHHRKVILQSLVHSALKRYVSAGKQEVKKQPAKDEEQGDAPKPMRVGMQGSYRPLHFSGR